MDAAAERDGPVDLALLPDLEVLPVDAVRGRHALPLVADRDEEAHASPGRRPSKAACFEVRLSPNDSAFTPMRSSIST